VAEHSYYVALYATYMAKFLNYNNEDIQFVTQVALTHDFDEMISGDIPSPFKDYIGDMSDERIVNASRSMAFSVITGTPTNYGKCHQVVQVADKFEATMFLVDEVDMGNNSVKELMWHLKDGCMKHAKELDVDLEKELRNHVDDPKRTRLCTRMGLA
jgi:5'-deoxynucleotidase YfbR-like HD superfamily hydrolase